MPTCNSLLGMLGIYIARRACTRIGPSAAWRRLPPPHRCPCVPTAHAHAHARTRRGRRASRQVHATQRNAAQPLHVPPCKRGQPLHVPPCKRIDTRPTCELLHTWWIGGSSPSSTSAKHALRLRSAGGWGGRGACGGESTTRHRRLSRGRRCCRPPWRALCRPPWRPRKHWHQSRRRAAHACSARLQYCSSVLAAQSGASSA